VKDARIISWQRDPETVHCTSTFTLVFALTFPNQKRTQVRLSLEPNHELFQNPTVEYVNADGEVVRTEAIVRHDHKVYKGLAYIRDEHTKAWRHCGWTRIMVLRDGSNPLFEGVFINDEDVHHIKLLSNYNLHREEEELNFESLDDPDQTMVVYRDSDRVNAQQSLLSRSLETSWSPEEANVSMCGHDRLDFNIQGGELDSGFGLGIFNRFVRRQSDVGGTTGGSTSQLASTIGDTNGCPSTRQVALVAAAVDCSYVGRVGNSSATRSQIISLYNQVRFLLFLTDDRPPLSTNNS
jgi:hypothetical protein